MSRLAAFFAVLAIAGSAWTASAHAYPPSTPLTTVPVPDVPRPGYLETITDPTWGTEVTRISSRQAFDDPSDAQRHAYSRIQPWNADGSLLMLGYNYPAPLLDGDTYEFLRQIPQPSEALWSNTDPDLMFGHSRNRFVAYDVAADETEVLHTFERYRKIAIGYGEGSLSNDDRFAALVGVRGHGLRDLLVYDVAADETVSRRSIGKASIDNVSMSQSGDWVVANWNRNGVGRNQGVEVFTRELTGRRQLSRDGQHADLAMTEGGDEYWVTVNYRGHSSLLAVPLDESGEKISIVGDDPGLYGGHVSCRNLERPGWCVYSDNGARHGDLTGIDQVFAFPIEELPEVQVFAHEHHSHPIDYSAEPHGVPSRDGERVLFASDWDTGDVVPVYAYVATAP